MKIYLVKNDWGETVRYVGSFKEAKEMCKQADDGFTFTSHEYPANRQGLLDALNVFGMDG